MPRPSSLRALGELAEERAAWLQLDPAIRAWERGPETGVVSHRSAAALYGLGHLAAGVHEFTLRVRRQSRRSDVRLHRGDIEAGECIVLRGLPVTRPARIATDLLIDREDPAAIGHVVADALREAYDHAGTIAAAMAPFAARHGLPQGDGVAMLEWLLEQTGEPDSVRWLGQARESLAANDREIPGDGVHVESEAAQTAENVCPACAGVGAMDGNECARCGGTGTVTEIVGDA